MARKLNLSLMIGLCACLVLALVLLPAPVAAAVSNAGAVKLIQFARGASSSEVHSAVVRGERALYAIEARRGQRMSLGITATEINAVFQLFAPGAKYEIRDSILQVMGMALPGAAEGDDAARWSGILPQSGRYLLVVGSTRGNATYRLTVSIR